MRGRVTALARAWLLELSRCCLAAAALPKRTLKHPAFLFNVYQHHLSPIFPHFPSPLSPFACVPARCLTTKVAKSLVIVSNTPQVRALNAMVSPLPLRCPPCCIHSTTSRFTRRSRVLGPKPYVPFRLSMFLVFIHVLADARAPPLARGSCGSALL